MPPTNDANEGALGAFHVFMRYQPQLTLLQFNAQKMFSHNDTETFMDNHFDDADYKDLHQQGRQDDSRQVERMRKEALVKHAEDKIQQKKKASEERKRKANNRAGRVAAVKLIFNKEEIANLKGQALTGHVA